MVIILSIVSKRTEKETESWSANLFASGLFTRNLQMLYLRERVCDIAMTENRLFYCVSLSGCCHIVNYTQK